MSEPRSVKELLELGERVLSDSSALFEDHDHAYEARQLLGSVLGVTEEEVQDLDQALEPSVRKRERFLSFVARRAGGEPTPFILGRIEFYGLDLKVKPGPFVPRPSSELTVDRAAKKLRRKQRPVVVDVCTGAGPIALAIADEFPEAEVWGTDIQHEGLALARSNAKRLGIRNSNFRQGDMYGALPSRLEGQVDLITGHVPYVPVGELDDLPTEVKDYEPVHTLTDNSADGLFLMRHAIDEGVRWLKPGGWLLLEMSDDTAPKVKKHVRKAGYDEPTVASDEDELSVVLEARFPGAKRAAR